MPSLTLPALFADTSFHNSFGSIFLNLVVHLFRVAFKLLLREALYAVSCLRHGGLSSALVCGCYATVFPIRGPSVLNLKGPL